MTSASDLVSDGYFPAELPPPFTTRYFGALVEFGRPAFPPDFADPKATATLCTYNLARPGHLRRRLGIPNPVTFLQLADVVETHWAAIKVHCDSSPYSLTKPTVPDPIGLRAVGRRTGLGARPEKRAALRASHRYVLSADISLCYPSMYTHSIPWALHGKAASKASKGKALLGDEIDTRVRACQDRQSVGLPIGPDTSLVLADVVLAGIDRDFISRFGRQPPGFRYIDDYELGFNTRTDAESALAALQGSVDEFGLQLNTLKTRIVEMPQPLESAWTSELRSFPVRTSAAAQRHDLIAYFGRAIEHSKTLPGDPVLPYACSRLLAVPIAARNWTLCESLLLQCAVAQPGVLRWFVDHASRAVSTGLTLDIDQLELALSRIICSHAPAGHASEVAWALWATLVLGVPLSDSAVSTAISLASDNCVALLALHAQDTGLIGCAIPTAAWAALLTTAELRSASWLLAYEAAIHGWLTSPTGIDHIAHDDAFDFLRDHDVAFYDESAAGTYASTSSGAIEATVGDYG